MAFCAAGSLNVVAGRIAATTYLGDVVQYAVLVGTTELTVQRQSSDPAIAGWRTGADVTLGWEPAAALVLTDDEAIAGEVDRHLVRVQSDDE